MNLQVNFVEMLIHEELVVRTESVTTADGKADDDDNETALPRYPR